MSGGVFVLIANDGRQDRLLNATDSLSERLKALEEYRRHDPNYEDSSPTLADIEETHVLFVNAYYKPFCALGYEYQKVKANSGNPQLGNTVTFSIPMYGDFFADMCLHVTLNQPTMIVNNGTAESDRPLMRWCEDLGQRLVEKYAFEINGNSLDEYTSYSVGFYKQLVVQPNKELGWDRCMGQEEPEEGFVDQPNWANSGVDSSQIVSRHAVKVHTGNQTPTAQKTSQIDLYIPIRFWFNKDVRLAIPSVAIPYGQRNLTVTLASQENLVNLVPRGTGTFENPNGTLPVTTNLVSTIELFVNNIFFNPDIHNIFMKRIGFTLVRVHRQQTINTVVSSDSVLLNQMKWPVEFFIVGMQVRDYSRTDSATFVRSGLDKWNKFQLVTDTRRSTTGWNSGRLALRATLVAPVGTALFNSGTAPPANLTYDSDNAADIPVGVTVGDIVEFTRGAVSVRLNVAAVDRVAFTLTFNESTEVMRTAFATAANVTFAANGDTLKFYTNLQQPATCTTKVYTPNIDTFSFEIQGVPIYKELPAKFFNAYMQLHYGGANLRVSKDAGIYLINFCLFPMTYQPTGHINCSRAREIYLKYTSTTISNNREGVLVVVASCLNFLLIADGSAVMRYTT